MKIHRMRILAHLRSASFQTIITNATALMGATVITAGLGFVYWWAAAHLFVANTVGLASATISAMTLLGTIATLGLGTLLISELPRQPERRDELITTALVIAAATGTGLGFLFVLVAPLISPEFRPLTQSISAIALFALGVGLTTMDVPYHPQSGAPKMQIKSMTALALTAAFMAFGSAPASANANTSTDPVAGSSRYDAGPTSARCTCGVRYYRVYRVPVVRYYRVYRVRYYYI